MIKVGKKAPTFMLLDSDENEVSLKDFSGTNVVLYFYPKDDTPGCTIEAIDFTKDLSKFKKKKTKVFGVSKDSTESHEKFCKKHQLKVTLLSDPELKAIKAYGAWGEKNNYGKKYMGIIRTTILIDAAGKIKQVWEKVKVKGHVDEVLKSL